MNSRDKRVILSSSFYVSCVDRTCEICGVPIFAGEKSISYGYVDRREGRKYRMWVCRDCNIDSPEGSAHYIQRYLYDNRFIEDIWEE